MSPTSADPEFYDKKRKWEKENGRIITSAEFIRDHYQCPENTSVAATGTSVFDPVLCELVIRWFGARNGSVLDPFAGGSVRGIVSSMLGQAYVGIDLRKEQVEANRAQWEAIKEGRVPDQFVADPDKLTPIHALEGGIYVKRDDLFMVNGAPGGKVRTCLALAKAAKAAGKEGLVTAGSRSSPQVNIVARVGAALGLAVRCHVPEGELYPEVQAAADVGAEIVQHRAGYNNVIIARAREDAIDSDWAEIPFGMECQEAVEQTCKQVQQIPDSVKRIVMPCGSGMSLAGVLWGLNDAGREDIKVLAVQVGADPVERLDSFAPPDWQERVLLVPSSLDYHEPAPTNILGDILLDPYYEAKCLPFLEEGDLFWIVGVRQSLRGQYRIEREVDELIDPIWIVGDSTKIDDLVPDDYQYDLVFSCPPYADLERYSDDPRDLSTMDYQTGFRPTYEAIIAAACRNLKDNRFACFVVGDVRDKTGCYLNFPGHTIEAFEKAGLRLYNEAILVTAIGSLPIRVGKQFMASRKLGKSHQNVLVFVKGDPFIAAKQCGYVDLEEQDA